MFDSQVIQLQLAHRLILFGSAFSMKCRNDGILKIRVFTEFFVRATKIIHVYFYSHFSPSIIFLVFPYPFSHVLCSKIVSSFNESVAVLWALSRVVWCQLTDFKGVECFSLFGKFWDVQLFFSGLCNRMPRGTVTIRPKDMSTGPAIFAACLYAACRNTNLRFRGVQNR